MHFISSAQKDCAVAIKLCSVKLTQVSFAHIVNPFFEQLRYSAAGTKNLPEKEAR
jgi:hypothetical protein